MTARALVSGVIFKAPVEKISKAGNAYVTATIRDGKGDAARWWKALVFGDVAMAEVLRLGDGDPLAVAGEFDCQPYKTDAGEDRLSWSIMVDAVLSARAKPKKAKPSQDNPQPFDTKRWEGGPRDGIPFDLRAIARALGGEVVGRQVVAPGPGHSPRDRSLSVTISAAAPEGFLAFSHAGDDFAECRDHVKARLGIDRRQQENRPQTPPRRPTDAPRDDDRDARALMFAKQIVSEMRPILGSPGETYLRDVRKIVTSAIEDVLERTDGVGWHPAVYFNEPGHALHGRKLGAIISVMTDMITAEPTGAISRTYIHEGRKLGKAKTLGSPAGIVRLSQDEDVLEGLHIAEGLETALDVMAEGFRPCWSTGSTAIMAKFPVLSGIEALTIIADHDAERRGSERAASEAARPMANGRS